MKLKKETDNHVSNLLQTNIIRQITNYINDTINFKSLRDNKYYIEFHNAFIFLIAFIILFNNNVYHLILILIIISLDALSIVVLHECPLTTLEKKYLNTSACDIRKQRFKKCNILYECEHEYEIQIELLTNFWLIVAGKCLIILFLKTFNIKLMDYSNLYGDKPTSHKPTVVY